MPGSMEKEFSLSLLNFGMRSYDVDAGEFAEIFYNIRTNLGQSDYSGSGTTKNAAPYCSQNEAGLIRHFETSIQLLNSRRTNILFNLCVKLS